MHCYLHTRIPADKQPHDGYRLTTGTAAVRNLHERAQNFFFLFF